MKLIALTIAAAIGLASPAFAHASEAYVTTDIGLMAGPDQDYPLIDNLEPGSEVDIQGCTEDSEWCDVIAYGERGWVPGGALEFEYENQWVLVPDYAPSYGIPIVVFSIQNYWDSYYRHRPFYFRRGDWYRWHPTHRRWPHFPPPRPIHGPPPMHHPIPPPRVVPLPHPIFTNPPPRVVPMPHPIFNQPPHGQPRQPVPNQPPRVVPMPHPVPDAQAASHRTEAPRSASKDKDQDQRQH